VSSDILDKIRARGHWDVAVRPEPFDRARLGRTELLDVLRSLVVSLRGWPVPFIDGRSGFLQGDDWVGEDVDAGVVSRDEAWRFYTSGQFLHLRVVSADRRVGAEATPIPTGAAAVIEVWEILFYLTELTEFAARLAVSPAGSPAVAVTATLRGMKHRELVAGTPSRHLDGPYRSSDDELTVTTSYQRDALIADARDAGVELSRAMLAKFGFNAGSRVLRDYQAELTRGQ
jgi:hypothetical protein